MTQLPKTQTSENSCKYLLPSSLCGCSHPINAAFKLTLQLQYTVSLVWVLIDRIWLWNASLPPEIHRKSLVHAICTKFLFYSFFITCMFAIYISLLVIITKIIISYTGSPQVKLLQTSFRGGGYFFGLTLYIKLASDGSHLSQLPSCQQYNFWLDNKIINGH